MMNAATSTDKRIALVTRAVTKAFVELFLLRSPGLKDMQFQ
jgi:hypothetical protein